jgi:hypothetical protein
LIDPPPVPGGPETSFQGGPTRLSEDGRFSAERPRVVSVVRHDLHEVLVLLMCGRGVGVGVVFRRTGQVAAQRIELAQVISQLREELQTAQRAGQGEDLRFELGPVELELTVAVDRQGGPDAKVRFWVIELGASGKFASNATQRIKLILDPRESGQEGDRRPVIAGDKQSGER